MGKGGKKRNWNNGQGEYPPPHVLENAAFLSYYRDSGIVPEAEMEAFTAALRKPLCVSFGITGGAHDPAALALRDFMEQEHTSKMGALVVSRREPNRRPCVALSRRHGSRTLRRFV